MGKKKASLKGLKAKYGSTVRKRYTRAYKLLKVRRTCPNCGSTKFKRISIGIWVCPKCGLKMAGEAYDVEVERL